MKKLRIGVLMGGKGLEKEVSFNTGRTVCDHLTSTRYVVIPLYQKNTTLFVLPWHFLYRGKTTDFEHRLEQEAEHLPWNSLKNYVDLIYIAQHGRYAEDGTLQGFLEILGVPYVGSKLFASALRADKIMHKTFLNNAGIETPRFITVEPYEIDDFQNHEQTIVEKLLQACISETYVVKPYNEGSSLGISIVKKDNLENALKKACYIEPGTKKRVLVEEKLEGMEFTCIILTDYKTGTYIPLVPTESIADATIQYFCYEQKYMPGRGIKRTPALCDAETTHKIQQTCISAMNALGMSNTGRIDGFVTKDNRIVVIDPNAFSGMAPSSYIFNQAAEANMSSSDLINHIIETELHYYGKLETIVQEENMQTTLTQKTRIAILLGGASNEKETSLDSGRNVYYKLNKIKYEVIPLFVNSSLELYHISPAQLVRNSTKEITEMLVDTQKIEWHELPNITDFVFNALHGGAGENGTVQGTLEMLGLPYNGSSVLASALCMNKYKTNQFLAAHGFDIPQNILINRADYTNNYQYDALFLFAEKNFSANKNLIVKPYDDGCSVMVQKVSTQEELHHALNKVLEHKDAVMVEEYIQGMELTVGVIGNSHPRALPPSQAIATQGVLSIEEKFLPGAGENQTPAPLPVSAIAFVQATMERVYKTIGCKGYVRIDCFYQSAEESPTGVERVIILEINTLPGLTPATCIFHQAAEIGLRPSEFLDLIIQFGFEEHGAEIKINQTQILTNQALEVR